MHSEFASTDILFAVAGFDSHLVTELTEVRGEIVRTVLCCIVY